MSKQEELRLKEIDTLQADIQRAVAKIDELIEKKKVVIPPPLSEPPLE